MSAHGAPLRDLEGVLGLADAALQVTGYDQVASVLLPRVAAVVGCDAATLTHLDRTTGHEVATLWPPGRVGRDRLEGYSAHAGTHPLRGPVAAQARIPAAARRPTRISEVMSVPRWRATPLAQDGLVDVHDQMAVVLTAPGGALHALAVVRSRGVFTDRQQEVLARCRPHVGAALARAVRDGHWALQLSPVPRWVPAAEAPGSPAAGSTPAGPDAHGGAALLSPRERQVLTLVASGLTDRQVARRLDLAPATVSKHLARVYRRTGAANRAAAAQLLQHRSPSDDQSPRQAGPGDAMRRVTPGTEGRAGLLPRR